MIRKTLPYTCIAALAFACFARGHALADDVRPIGIVGPVHGAWTLNGQPASLTEPVRAGATVTAVKSATGGERSITFYMYDGRLVKKSCADQVSCADVTTLQSAGGKDFVDPDIANVTDAIVRYRVPTLALAPSSASAIAPNDGIVRLQDDGTLLLEPIFADVPPGAYRLAFQRLDPTASFAASEPIYKSFSWSQNGGPLASSTLTEGLYAMKLFARGTPMKEIGQPTWILVTNKDARTRLDRFVYVSALTATWEDDEARQLFLRAYLVTVAAAP